MYLPDYEGNSLVNLMSSLGLAYGRDNGIYSQCTALSQVDLNQYDNIILLVIDGLGHRYVQSKPGLFRTHCSAELTSVFPSTTATSITAFMTGLAPQQHGLTGWFTYLREVGGVTAVLPFRLRGSDIELTERRFNLADVYQHPVFFDQLNCNSVVVSENWILDTAFNKAHTGRAQKRGYENLSGMFDQLQECVKVGQGKQYIYAYWSQFDHLSHIHGNQSEPVSGHFRELQAKTEKFISEISGTNTLLLITSDHGFIDTTPDKCINVNDHPILQGSLTEPLSGEPRVAYCYVQTDKHKIFTDYVNSNFSNKLDCIASQDMIDNHFYGLGEPHPKLSERVGDFALIMKENNIIKDWMPQERPFFHYGVHGGVSELEMFTPLILLEA
ncbi:Alkaline phosphodiesterase I / Nucleotide pyrophosphatase [hydrothermal vent metagenome]|uniref:Alkaline phosphodiesterase I / Nucleotide pyrophosphatase n=1 Tax=hydrothermal vent metagenome TaxID=652676 RepID=A0A3B0ZZE0_9ZZZZ